MLERYCAGWAFGWWACAVHGVREGVWAWQETRRQCRGWEMRVAGESAKRTTDQRTHTRDSSLTDGSPGRFAHCHMGQRDGRMLTIRAGAADACSRVCCAVLCYSVSWWWWSELRADPRGRGALRIALTTCLCSIVTSTAVASKDKSSGSLSWRCDGPMLGWRPGRWAGSGDGGGLTSCHVPRPARPRPIPAAHFWAHDEKVCGRICTGLLFLDCRLLGLQSSVRHPGLQSFALSRCPHRRL